jgi:hypothetical protein
MIIPDPTRPEVFDFEIPFYNSEFNSRLPELNREMYNIIYNRFKQSNVVGSAYINCINLPKFFVEFNQICIFARRMDTLSGINKVLSCEYLTIENIKSIKSSILGILLIKNLDQIWGIHGDLQVKPEWLDIINKHLKSGRRLRKCKQELEDAGLKEFAKL